MSELKMQRNFLVVVLAALLVFGGMIFLFYNANAASGNNKYNISGECINKPCNNLPLPGDNLNNSIKENVQIQDIYIKALSSGTYDKSEVRVKKGVPVNLHFSADPNAGCGRYLSIYGMNVSALSKNGEEVVVNFTPQKEGFFEYNCGMRMFRPGKLVVVS